MGSAVVVKDDITLEEFNKHFYVEDSVIYWKDIPKKTGSLEGAGNIHSTGYIRVTFKGKGYFAHKLLWLYYYGKYPDHMVDHIDRNKTNNKKENLRKADHVVNGRNRKVNRNNTTGITGVHYVPSRLAWQARINGEGSRIFLGYFDNLFDAVAARRSKELELGYIGE